MKKIKILSLILIAFALVLLAFKSAECAVGSSITKSPQALTKSSKTIQNQNDSSPKKDLNNDENDDDDEEINDLPDNAGEIEHSRSWTLFFILSILACSILLIHFLITIKFHYVPESLAVIFLGAIIGLVLKLLSQWNIADWTKEEMFPPTMFFLVLLPPIIFESGYNLHKGNFFQNIGSILVFAIIGTAISAFVMGAGIFLFGRFNLIYALDAKESFAFGSLVSAVDPVATLAIFNALDVDPVLYMLVFGESILNDAVAIVLTNTILTVSPSTHSFFYFIFIFIGKFCLMFFASALIGVLFGILSALLFKYVDLRKTPSLEMAFMLLFMYSPYAFAEAIRLSGIMAILFAGVVMSHYTHNNLSSVTRITIQQTFRTLSFISETAVFAYLGLAIFSFRHVFKPSLVIAGVVMCLASRALNIFPLSLLLNYFREHKITRKMQFIMWFSGLRGAIAFALSINLDFEDEVRHVIVTSTLILVLFTTLVLGGSTLPLMKLLNVDKNRRKKHKDVFLSKTKEMGEAIDEFTEKKEGSDTQDVSMDDPMMSSLNIHIVRSGQNLRGFAKFDEKYLKPFLVRKFTAEEMQDGKLQMHKLTNKWCDEVRGSKHDAKSDKEEEEKLNDKSKSAKNNKVYFDAKAKGGATNIIFESDSEADGFDLKK